MLFLCKSKYINVVHPGIVNTHNQYNNFGASPLLLARFFDEIVLLGRAASIRFEIWQEVCLVKLHARRLAGTSSVRSDILSY